MYERLSERTVAVYIGSQSTYAIIPMMHRISHIALYTFNFATAVVVVVVVFSFIFVSLRVNLKNRARFKLE